MANEQNLIPFTERSESEVRELNRKGGINSGKVRAEKKAAREIADAILSMPTWEGASTDYEDATALDAVIHGNPSVKATIIATLAKKATEGNIRAAELLFTITGEYSKSVAMQATFVEDESAKEVQEYFKRKYNGGLDDGNK